MPGIKIYSGSEKMAAEFQNVSKGKHENIPINKIKAIPSIAVMLTQLGRELETRHLTVKCVCKL